MQAAAADVLIAQLASLKNSTAETERSFLAGVAADEAYTRQQAEAERAAKSAAAQADDGGGGAGGSGIAPSPGTVVDPAAARAYASSVESGIQLASRRLQLRQRGLRHPAIPSRQQDGIRGQRLAHERRDPDQLGPGLHRGPVRNPLRGVGTLRERQLVLTRLLLSRPGSNGLVPSG